MAVIVPNTKTVVSYSYSITVGGTQIGTLQGFNPSSTRTLERIREINYSGPGSSDTYEIVPGRSEFKITLDRIEIYKKSLMEALGIDALEDLTQIQNSIDITESRTDFTGKTRSIKYMGCWIGSWGKNITEGTLTVKENVTMEVERISVSSMDIERISF